MFSLKDVANSLYVSTAIRAGMLCTGRLLGRPVETPHAYAARSWLVHGELHFRMFELHQAGVPMQHASGVVGAHGIEHLVLCQRLDQWEHRFVIQLLGPTMREFIAQGDETARLVLQNNLGPGLASVAAPADWRSGIRPGDVASVPARPEAALAALLEAASHCLGTNPEGIPTSPVVKDVCVSLVMAPEYEALAASHARRVQKAAAR